MTIPSLSDLNRQHPRLLLLGVLTTVTCILAIFGYVTYQLSTYLTESPIARDVITGAILLGSVAAICLGAFYNADPQNRRRK